jgi:hypothetical protein
MNKKIEASRKSITLIELLVSLVVISTMVLSFYSLENYARQQVLTTDRRAKVENGLAYALEHMSKYIVQAAGNPAIALYPPAGFQILVDRNNPQTPSDFSDDDHICYELSGNTLSVSCPIGPNCNSFASGVLSDKIVANFNNSVLPANPTDGFYVLIEDGGSSINIGLVGRYYPDQVAIPVTNPQVAMKTKVVCNNCSSH